MPKDNVTADFSGLELPMTHLERMELAQFNHDKAKELAKIEADKEVAVAKANARRDRPEMWQNLGIAFAISLFFICAVSWIFYDKSRPDPPPTQESFQQTEAGREQNCIVRGGGWVPADIIADASGSGSADHGMCVFPGKVADAP